MTTRKKTPAKKTTYIFVFMVLFALMASNVNASTNDVKRASALLLQAYQEVNGLPTYAQGSNMIFREIVVVGPDVDPENVKVNVDITNIGEVRYAMLEGNQEVIAAGTINKNLQLNLKKVTEIKDSQGNVVRKRLIFRKAYRVCPVGDQNPMHPGIYRATSTVEIGGQITNFRRVRNFQIQYPIEVLNMWVTDGVRGDGAYTLNARIRINPRFARLHDTFTSFFSLKRDRGAETRLHTGSVNVQTSNGRIQTISYEVSDINPPFVWRVHAFADGFDQSGMVYFYRTVSS